MEENVHQLVDLFNHIFGPTYRTILVPGGEYPIYIPADDSQPFHKIIFRENFFSSALHEISHWCIAGEKRRLIEDFGYWYNPDGRDLLEQSEFEKVEIKPQALEWIFSDSVHHEFKPSVDNLSLVDYNSDQFKKNILIQKEHYLKNGLPNRRSRIFNEGLLKTFGKNNG